MKRILTQLSGLLIVGVSIHAETIPSITETSAGLTSTIGATISGSQDDWTVTAPSGFSFLFIPLSTTYFVPEIDNPLAFNILTPIGPGPVVSSFTWRSDVTLLPLGATPLPLVSLLPPGTEELPPVPVILLDTGDPPPKQGVPDTGSTLLLLGLGLLGLWLAARAGTGADSALRV